MKKGSYCGKNVVCCWSPHSPSTAGGHYTLRLPDVSANVPAYPQLPLPVCKAQGRRYLPEVTLSVILGVPLSRIRVTRGFCMGGPISPVFVRILPPPLAATGPQCTFPGLCFIFPFFSQAGT